MEFSTKYMDTSLYFKSWKTKFIERFCVPYAKLLTYINKSDSIDKKVVVKVYLQLFFVVMNVLKRILKSDYGIRCVFFTDIIFYAAKENLIEDKMTYFKVLQFLEKFGQNKDYAEEFSLEYMKIFASFSQKFKSLVKVDGNIDKDYVLYDNSEILWGLQKEYYDKIIQFFLQYPKLKIVRIFGSRVTNSYQEFSDLDFIFEGTYSSSEYDEMVDKFIELEIPYVIDVFNIYAQNKAFIYRNILRSNLFYERKNYVQDDYITILLR